MSFKTRNEDDCRRIEPLLDDLVDGRLTAAEQQRVETHVVGDADGADGAGDADGAGYADGAGDADGAGCEACAARLASLERLLREVDALPRSMSPESDLWPGIEPRLTEHRFAERRPVVAVRKWHWLQQAAAAVVFMALGGVLSQLLLSGRLVDLPAPIAAADGEQASEADFALAEARLALAEADLLRAKEALWSAVYTSHDAASPETREVVERNLAVIAGAIRELRAALETDPGNHQLEGLLLAQHRSEIGLLQRLARARSTRAQSAATEI